MPRYLATYSVYVYFIPFLFCIEQSCINGDVTLEISPNVMPSISHLSLENSVLYGKRGVHAGRVKVCINNTTGTVCSTQWDDRDASVVCTQLGYSPYGNQKLCKVVNISLLYDYYRLVS